jgi:hypothetical protein
MDLDGITEDYGNRLAALIESHKNEIAALKQSAESSFLPIREMIARLSTITKDALGEVAELTLGQPELQLGEGQVIYRMKLSGGPAPDEWEFVVRGNGIIFGDMPYTVPGDLSVLAEKITDRLLDYFKPQR